MPTLAVPMPAGKHLGSDGNVYVDQYPPGYLCFNQYDGTPVSSTTTETSLFTGSVAASNVYPIPDAAGAMFKLQVRGTFLSSVGSLTSAIAAYYGAYQIFTKTSATLTASPTVRSWGFDLDLDIETINGANAGKIRIAGTRWGLDANMPVGTGWIVPGAVSALGWADGASSGISANLITNAVGNLNVTATHSSNAGTITTTLLMARLTYHPKNY